MSTRKELQDRANNLKSHALWLRNTAATARSNGRSEHASACDRWASNYLATAAEIERQIDDMAGQGAT